jgi:hypothetical protein
MVKRVTYIPFKTVDTDSQTLRNHMNMGIDPWGAALLAAL